MPRVITGLENLLQSSPSSDIKLALKGQRLGLLANPASIRFDFRHAKDLIAEEFPGQLTCLFSPQHGFFAEKQDNMIESKDETDTLLNIPIFSLYGETRIPTQNMFDPFDILLVDLQDVGTRVYTFIYTLSYCMEAAKIYNKKVIVLDRPNPVGGERVEGNCLKAEWSSFVGRFPIPMRHGLTIGEIAILFNRVFGIECDLEVIPLIHWQRNTFFNATGLPWVPPSPNLPTQSAAMVYPGQVIFEGTNISEGRGTTQPFEIFGAPFINPNKMLSLISLEESKGIHLRPLVFEPTYHKWCGNSCKGFQLHVTEPTSLTPFYLSLKLLWAIRQCHENDLKWKSPPYEYEFDRLPIDLIFGDDQIRQFIDAGTSFEKILAYCQGSQRSFEDLRKKVFLY